MLRSSDEFIRTNQKSLDVIVKERLNLLLQSMDPSRVTRFLKKPAGVIKGRVEPSLHPCITSVTLLRRLCFAMVGLKDRPIVGSCVVIGRSE